MKRLVLLIFFLFFLFPQKAIGSFNFYISDVGPSTISSGDQEITVRLKITDLPSESYFRIALQKPNGGSYFGFVQNNNGEWVKVQSLSSDQCVSYVHVADLSTSDLILKLKAGDDTSIDQSNYKIKAHRFTKSCSSYTEATNSADMILNFPSSTPTNAPSTVSSFTPTKTPTPSLTLAPSIKISLKSVQGASTSITQKASASSSILSYSSPSPREIAVAGETQENKSRVILTIILSTGAVLFIIAAGILIKKYWREIIEWLST